MRFITTVIQVLTPLLIFALICVVIFEMRRMRSARREALKTILGAIDQLSSKLATSSGGNLQKGQEVVGAVAISNEIQQGIRTVAQSVERAFGELSITQRESLDLASIQHKSFSEFLAIMSEQRRALEDMVNSLETLKTGQGANFARMVPEHESRKGNLSSFGSPMHTAPPLAERSSEFGRSRERFDKLSKWLYSNMRGIMQRSLVDRSEPAALLLGAPEELSPTGEIVDGVVLLVGTKDYDERLALVLPGSYIGSRYYNWFNIPKGTNERVEDTVEPALVKQVDDDFTVLKRGTVRQN